ncbi:MAG: PTS sugar transporter subunit IIB [Longimicrobiales bacterium]|nr:PTS sugar transporter subunit IIB [Longimicrobiales bacterium]
MSIQLLRVDERLIHGQVVIGWGRRLHPARYIVVDDLLAASGWEQELYLLAVEGETEVRFLDVGSAGAELARLREDPIRTIVLTRDLQTMSRLAEGGRLAGMRVNLGGLHPSPGRRALRGWLNLGPEDEIHLQRLVDGEVEIEARDLPDHPAVTPDEFLP